MAILVMDGWGTSTRKIQAIKHLRAHFGIGLREAKDLTDRVQAGERVTVPVEDDSPLAAALGESTAHTLAEELRACGIDARIE